MGRNSDHFNFFIYSLFPELNCFGLFCLAFLEYLSEIEFASYISRICKNFAMLTTV